MGGMGKVGTDRLDCLLRKGQRPKSLGATEVGGT